MKTTDTRLATPAELQAVSGERYCREAVPPPGERMFPPDLLEEILNGSDPEDVLFEYERRGWRQVKHLAVVK